MDEIIKDRPHFSNGINISDLMSSAAESHIDVDSFKKADDLFSVLESDDDESDVEDALKNIEDNVSKLLLSSPEYHSFSELATKMVDCLANGGVKILILEEGTGPIIPVDAEVTIHYAAYWEKNKIPFDSSLTLNKGAPFKFRLGTGQCLVGIEIALSMVKGASARFLALLQPEYAWGKRGAPPRIQPKPALFVVSLLNVNDHTAAARFNDLPMMEQTKFEVTIKTVTALHAQAKSQFAKSRYKDAIKTYQQSMNVLGLSKPKDEAEEAEIKKLKITVYTNLCVCYYKIKKPNYIFIMCKNLDRVSDVDKHCKALFYCGKAHEMLNKHDEALKYYKKALKLEPKNKEIGKALVQLDEYFKKSKLAEKELWRNAFKAEIKKENVTFDVDDDFQNGVREICQELAGTMEFNKFDLPNGFTRDEVDCIQTLVNDFEGLEMYVDGEGKRKKVSIVRKLL